ncbi:MAG: SGNH/GDSL hydrolase family protein [Oscillospiraceae bacterium]|nr:SGNH/GDSL hydrolase family protein [Oscillospiraceae bacterium]
MKLDLNTVRSVATGAARILEEADGFHFIRFTQEQEDFYKDYPNHYPKVFATSGVKLSFRTNSPSLGLKIITSHANSRMFFALDVFVNGKFLDDIRNYEELELKRKYTLDEYPLGEFEKEFNLGEGEKDITVYLPWNVKTVLREISLADGATVTPNQEKKRLLCFGDSITMGHDALHPPRRYTAQLANYLGYQEYNKGIGGEKFPPTLATLAESFTPDLITVAYGTNDWRHRTLDVFKQTCREFFINLRNTYPDTPIYAICPIWRKIWANEYECGPFRQLPDLYRDVAKDVPNMTVIDAFEFVPAYTDYYADLTLHPNGAGFDRYFEGLKPFFEKHRA